MSEVFYGVSASSGIAFGKIFIVRKKEIIIDKSLVDSSETEAELQKIKKSISTSKEQLLKLKKHTERSLGANEAEIFRAQVEILDDPFFEERIDEKILNENKNAELALWEASEEIIEEMKEIEDSYIRQRAEDIKDISTRVLRNIRGILPTNFDEIDVKSIIVAKTLTPAHTVTMDINKVLGFATDSGGATSHTAIMARAIEIPAVVGLFDFFDKVKDGDMLILDGYEGKVILNPSEEEVEAYKRKKQVILNNRRLLEKNRHKEAVTLDGKKVKISANIGMPGDTEHSFFNGAEGVGLFRTEFLYMTNNRFPTEEEQLDSYIQVIRQCKNKGVIVRTVDVGGDKGLTYFNYEKEPNPFLGCRGIRMSLDNIEIFKTQLRAILRASAFGKIDIMFPMIISIEEILTSKKLLEECMEELRLKNINFNKDIRVGIMIETPAAVVMADELAKIADFFSIGTNDLIQYTLAVGRGNIKMSNLYNPFHPAVVRSIKNVIDAAHKEGKLVGMCGEFAANKYAAKLLLGLGLDVFSISGSMVPQIKDVILKSSYADAKELADMALKELNADNVEKMIIKDYECCFKNVDI